MPSQLLAIETLVHEGSMLSLKWIVGGGRRSKDVASRNYLVKVDQALKTLVRHRVVYIAGI